VTFVLCQVAYLNIASREASTLHSLSRAKPDRGCICQPLVFLLVFQLRVMDLAEIVRTFVHDDRNDCIKFAVFRFKDDPHLAIACHRVLKLTTHFFTVFPLLIQKLRFNSNLAGVESIMP